MKFPISFVCLFSILFFQINFAYSDYRDVDTTSCAGIIYGTIEISDLEKIKENIKKNKKYGQSLCLNSPGGSWKAAVSIAKYLLEYHIPTHLENGASCLSACAIAFMGGTNTGYQLAGFPARSMHPRARLGFHAPYIKLQGGKSYDNSEVERSFKIALKAIASLLSFSHTKHAISKFHVIEPFLIPIILDYGPNEYLEINTIRLVNLLNIQVIGIKVPKINNESVLFACENSLEKAPLGLTTIDSNSLQKILLGKKTPEIKRRDYSKSSAIFKRERKSGDISPTTIIDFGIRGYESVIETSYESGCFLHVDESKVEHGYLGSYSYLTISKHGEFSEPIGDHTLLPIHFYNPETLLSQIPLQNTIIETLKYEGVSNNYRKNTSPDNVIKQYENYIVKKCGEIFDQNTGLTWYVGPDRNVTWYEMRDWVQNLRSCDHGWRTPRIGEIKTIFKRSYTAGTGYFSGGRHWPAHMHPVFDKIGGGSWIWSGESVGHSFARSFNMNQGKSIKYKKMNTKFSTRAFAVK